MPGQKREEPHKKADFSSDIRDFVKRRADAREVKASDVRTHLEIQLLISELDNILLNLSKSNPEVITARNKLIELKALIVKTLDIK